MTSANYDEDDYQIFNFDETILSPNIDEFLEDPLCVPRDALESLERINFWEDKDSNSIVMFSNTSEKEKVKLERSEKVKLERLEKEKPEKKSFTNASTIQNNHGCTREPKNLSNITKKSRSKILRATCISSRSSSKWKIDFQNSKQNSSIAKFCHRRCSHCDVSTTPQWRAGPLGRNTLCNACGMRYKSGRLFPEYRPAKSPTFDDSKHSNFHRKIIRMRA
ncbi:GATA transcription factor 5, partial [Mucuna pruriens]